MSNKLQCRACKAPVSHTFLDLGPTPLANSYLKLATDDEQSFPLHALVCEACFLVQLNHDIPPEAIFSDYAYFSSFSDSWLKHCAAFCEMAAARFSLSPQSLVVEIASNDGYLLRNFVARDIPVLGIEPAANIARVAESAGIRTKVAFFGRDSAKALANEGFRADLLIGNNVTAHVPNLDYFVGGFAEILKPEGVISLEFPHLLTLMDGVQFDTIYHEHYSYISLHALERAFAARGLRVFDVEQVPTHGGSIRVFGCHAGAHHKTAPGRDRVRQLEADAKLDKLSTYDNFEVRVEHCRKEFREFLDRAKAAGTTVAAYGAAAKGNTFLNYCRVSAGDIACAADKSPHKQGRYLPGSRIPICSPEQMMAIKPDYLIILPWNLRAEIMEQLAGIRKWGGQFVTALPTTKIWQ